MPRGRLAFLGNRFPRRQRVWNGLLVEQRGRRGGQSASVPHHDKGERDAE